jgi:hypothetical protein
VSARRTAVRAHLIATDCRRELDTRSAKAADSILHVEHFDDIDHACLELLLIWSEQHRVTGGDFQIDWETLHARFRRERGG